MKSFMNDVLEKQPISQSLLSTVRLIGEYKGKQDLFKQQAPQVLNTLQNMAIIQSTESSNRLEGITAPIRRIEKLVAKKTKPQNRSEEEIAGYRDVLNSIHTKHEQLTFSVNTVLSLHRNLFQFLPEKGGAWKKKNNVIMEVTAGGQRSVRFHTVSAKETPAAMKELHERFGTLWELGRVEPLLLIPTYVLDFLCIHPFRDGNGRIARLVTLLLLYKAGYEVGRYISLEQIVERTRESYYDTLYRSSQYWHQARHTLIPWWEYFLGIVLLTAYREFEGRVGMITRARGAKTDMVRDAIMRLPNHFRYSDIEKVCPGVSQPTIKRVLASLKQAGKIRCIKAGRDAVWEKSE
jgi:Fic family protein